MLGMPGANKIRLWANITKSLDALEDLAPFLGGSRLLARLPVLSAQSMLATLLSGVGASQHSHNLGIAKKVDVLLVCL